MDTDETRFLAGDQPRDLRVLPGDRTGTGTPAPRENRALVQLAGGPARSLFAGLALATVVAAGYGAGSGPWGPRELSQLVSTSCLAGIALACWGCLAPGRAVGRTAAALVALALIAYPFVVDGTETIKFVWDAPGVLASVAWLAPLAVAGLVLLRRGAWLTGAGSCLMLFAGVTALAYNVSHTTSGLAFFSRWAS